MKASIITAGAAALAVAGLASGCSASVSTTPSGTSAPAASGTAAAADAPAASSAAASPSATAKAAPARVGSYFDLKDDDGNVYRVTLEKVIDPAQGADSYTTRAAQGDSTVGAVNFQLPSAVKVAKIQWATGGYGATVQWLVSGS